jgi:hypothetical protein
MSGQLDKKEMNKKIQKLNFCEFLKDYKYAIYIQVWKFDISVLGDLKFSLQSLEGTVDYKILRTNTVFVESSYAPIYVIFLSAQDHLFLRFISLITQNLRISVLRVQHKDFNLSIEQLKEASKTKSQGEQGIRSASNPATTSMAIAVGFVGCRGTGADLTLAR